MAVAQANDIYQLLSTEFYCVSPGNKCCRTNGGPSWHHINDVSKEGGREMSSGIWDEYIFSKDASFQVDIKLLLDKTNFFEHGDGFAFVLQRDGYDALGADVKDGYEGIPTALPAVTFERLPTKTTSGFKISIPMAEHSPTAEVMTINESYDVNLFYDGIKKVFQVGFHDKLLLEGNIDVFQTAGGDSDNGLFWGFTSGGINCIEDIVSPRHLQIEEHHNMKKAEEEPEDSPDDEEEEEEEEAEEAEEAAEAEEPKPEVSRDGIIIDEQFGDPEHSKWVFANNLFGHYGALEDQMRGKFGIKVGRDGTKGMRIRLLDEKTPDNAEQDIAAGYQHQFECDHDVENLELFVDFRAYMSDSFTPEDCGEVRAAIDGRTSVELFQCFGGDCNTDWTPRLINFGPVEAGAHTIQIGTVLKKKSPRSAGGQRSFTTRFNALIVKEMEPTAE